MKEVQFDPKKHYIGTLCKRKHTYQGKRKSIRYHTNETCVLCHALNGKKYVPPKPKTRVTLTDLKEEVEIRIFASINCSKYKECLNKASRTHSSMPCHKCAKMAINPDSYKQELLNPSVDEHSLKISLKETP